MSRPTHDVSEPLDGRLDGKRALALLHALPTGSPPMCELFRLADTLGVRVIDWETVPTVSRRASTFLGTGRLADIARRVGAIAPPQDDDVPTSRQAPPAPNYDLVVVDAHLSPRQQAQLEDGLGVPVLDRTAVILHIFESRAQTREARLEVELARLRFSLPRVRQSGAGDDRRGGGGRGERGHTNVQLEKMRIRDRIATLSRDLMQLQQQDDARRTQRAEVWTVALVGYTNAGKSTLMRRLTGADVLAEDKLFATLGTTVRRLHPAATPPILVCDTVGFIRQLPHELVASFHSTLDQAHTARLRLLVVDASDPEWRLQLACVIETLRDSDPAGPWIDAPPDDEHPTRVWTNEAPSTEIVPLTINQPLMVLDDETEEDPDAVMPPPRRPRKQRRQNPEAVEIPPAIEQLVFNKCDQLDTETRRALAEEFPDALFVSALQPDSVRELRAAIIEHRDDTLAEAVLDIPWSRGELMRTVRTQANVVSEHFHEDGTRLRVRGNPEDLANWAAQLSATYH